VYDGTNTTLYVNGTLTNSSVVGTSVLPRTVPFTVARGSDPSGSFFKGALDELAVYPSALSVAQIARHFALGK
ncbi:MAG TPA: LamG-like jellyroll fold domain-containing protein, partial [Polyangiaceae bacterium]